MNIKHLISGGLITNYYCTSRCRHCLYACSPSWEKQYITPYTALELFKKLKIMGCHSVHIGGGEPFLNTDKLINVLKTSKNQGIKIDYIETNSSWYKDHKSTIYILKELRTLGISTLLISMSPFHNEYVPFYKVKGLINSCHTTGINVFPWMEKFYSEIDRLDDTSTHTPEEYTDIFGNDYFEKIPGRYWVNPGGRAISFFRKHFLLQPLNDILNKNQHGCKELTDTSHFHLDLYGNYIPGLCSGLAIRYKDLGKTIPPKQYPFIHLLYEKGIPAFMDMAVKEFHFQPKEYYYNKCGLCLDIRKHIINTGHKSKELQPDGFYDNLD